MYSEDQRGSTARRFLILRNPLTKVKIQVGRYLSHQIDRVLEELERLQLFEPVSGSRKMREVKQE